MTHVSINVFIHPYCLATYETSQRVSPTQCWLWSMTPRHSGCKTVRTDHIRRTETHLNFTEALSSSKHTIFQLPTNKNTLRLYYKDNH